MRKNLLLIALCAAVGPVFDASACMTIVAGRKVSSTGHVIVGHNEDDHPPLTIHHGMLPARDWPAGKHVRKSRLARHVHPIAAAK